MKPDTISDTGDASGPPSATRSPLSSSTRNWIITVGFVAVGCMSLLVATTTRGRDTGTGIDPIDRLEFRQADGSVGTLADFEGKPMVINFFASWCGPCRNELPDFEEAHLAAGDDVRFLGISHDLNESSWLSFVENIDITYETVYQPNQEIFQRLGFVGIPATAFVSADGEVVRTWLGPLDKETLESLITDNLGVGA